MAATVQQLVDAMSWAVGVEPAPPPPTRWAAARRTDAPPRGAPTSATARGRRSSCRSRWPSSRSARSRIAAAAVMRIRTARRAPAPRGAAPRPGRPCPPLAGLLLPRPRAAHSTIQRHHRGFDSLRRLQDIVLHTALFLLGQIPRIVRRERSPGLQISQYRRARRGHTLAWQM